MHRALVLVLLSISVSACGAEKRTVAEQAPAKGVAARPLHFGALPREGIVVETERLGRPTLTFVGLEGHVYGRLKIGLDSDSQLLRGVVVGSCQQKLENPSHRLPAWVSIQAGGGPWGPVPGAGPRCDRCAEPHAAASSANGTRSASLIARSTSQGLRRVTGRGV